MKKKNNNKQIDVLSNDGNNPQLAPVTPSETSDVTLEFVLKHPDAFSMQLCAFYSCIGCFILN